MQNLLKDKKTAVIGGGPVGLMMARLLQQKGAEVKVYERDYDSTARIRGGTLDLHKGSGQEAMKKAGLLENYYATAIPMGIIFADTQGNVLHTRPITPETQYDNPEINRNQLRNLLLDSLAPETVAWDRKLISIEENNGKWVLHFQNQPDAEADFIIVANGGMSKIRSYITDTETEETGSFIIQGDVSQPGITCPEVYQLCNGNRLMAAGRGNLLVVNPYNNGSLTYGLIIQKPEEWSYGKAPGLNDSKSVMAFLSDRLSDWGEPYQQLFRETSVFAALPTRKLALDKPWKAYRPLPVTLIGDAAHLMPPFAGQGVNTGLVDALTLSENLTEGRFETLEAAISNYEQKMKIYASEAQLESAINEKQMHNPDFSFTSLFD